MRKCDRFFDRLDQLGLVVTYEEVRLKTGHSEVEPNAVDLQTRFSRRVPLQIPLVSAAMDTVTESRLAIALAKLGGLGVIHKSLAPEEQKEEVRRVKFHLSGRIGKPISVRDDMALSEIRRMREERRFSFFTFPVLDENGRLVGLLTENDFDFSQNDSLSASQVMTRDLITAGQDTSIDEAYGRMLRSKKKVLPLVDGEGRLAGMYLWNDLKRIKSGSSASHNVDADGRLRVAVAVGVLDDAFERVELMREYVDAFVIDTAHGDSRNVFDTIRELKGRYGDGIDIVAGNVSEGESAKRLADAGADGVKIGQGPGSICTTRIVAGVGCAQVSAVYAAARALEGTDIPVCADGGVVHSGDIPIAIGAGAHSVMLGKVLAGTKEAPGEVDYRYNTPMKLYRGMGSLSALAESRASRERYRESGKDRLVPEGVESFIPYTGELGDVIYQFVGGLRKGMGYVGAATIEELRAKADFHRSTGAGMKENHPHDVKIERDAPNYRRDS